MESLFIILTSCFFFICLELSHQVSAPAFCLRTEVQECSTTGELIRSNKSLIGCLIVLQTRTGVFHKAGSDRGRIGKAPVTATGNIAIGWRLVLMSGPLGFKTTARHWANRKRQANSRVRRVNDMIQRFNHRHLLSSFEKTSGLYLNDGIAQWNRCTIPFAHICVT